MDNELIIQLFEQERATARIEAELGALTREVARLAVEIADLKRDWPAANIVLVDEANIN
jgi:hypothetical protein